MSQHSAITHAQAASNFRTTHWTDVLDAAQPGSLQGQEAFAKLYNDYWYPLYAFIRWRGYQPQAAEDITQDFFLRLFEKQALSSLQREGGRFRSFLLRALENFLANEWDRAHAQKRGGGQRPLSLDAEEGEARFALEKPDPVTPESAFERQWTLTLLEHVMDRLRGEYAANGKGALFGSLHGYLSGTRQGPAYTALASKLGMTEGAIKIAVHRMRQRYGQLLREEIARTVSRPEEVDAELKYLIQVVGQ